ncbi:hypothetical protein [Pedobacter sp. L105]|uniref:hypothetical protein n=1 Tax=Pedobacter sp. L105 TaxID=1641871 RepID=UPI00131BD092|nr:hypothetical protein [Pedobacter sp. L105]
MKNEVHADLGQIILRLRKRLTSNVFFGILMFLLGSILVFVVQAKSLNFIYILCDSIFLITIGYIQYYQIVPVGLTINDTAIEVEILEEYIIVKTSPFKVFLWIDKASKELRFKKDELKIRKIPYPNKSILDLDMVIKLTDEENTAYVPFYFFDKELEEKLTPIKVSI